MWLCDDDRGPQSQQSVPSLQMENSAPGPPSSQSLSKDLKHVFEQDTDRGPQSQQSVPRLQMENSAPGPPSSQSLSKDVLHVFEQVCPTVPLSWRKNSRAPSLPSINHPRGVEGVDLRPA